MCEVLICTDDLTVLENFAFGDTPTEDAIASLLRNLFDDDEEELELDLYSLSRATDVRPLVLRTLLTWLELDGFLEGGTPKYAGYRFKPLKAGAEILELVDGERRDFLRAIFKLGKKKKTWVDIDVDEAARVTSSPRERVIRALDWLSEQGHLELKPQGVRHRFRVLKKPGDDHAAHLAARMIEREKNETERLAHVVRLTETDRCQVRALARYFGDPEGDPLRSLFALFAWAYRDLRAARCRRRGSRDRSRARPGRGPPGGARTPATTRALFGRPPLTQGER